jgi:hypothetical protein
MSTLPCFSWTSIFRKLSQLLLPMSTWILTVEPDIDRTLQSAGPVLPDEHPATQVSVSPTSTPQVLRFTIDNSASPRPFGRGVQRFA